MKKIFRYTGLFAALLLFPVLFLLGSGSPEELPSAEKPRKKKKRGKAVFLSLLALVLVGALILSLLPGASTGSIEVEEELLTAKVTRGSLTEMLLSGGSLQESEAESIALAGDVRISDWLVEEGDFVEEGTLLAALDANSVLSAITKVQAQMSSLDKALEKARSDQTGSVLTAPVAGRVKAVFAAPGDSVVDTVYEHGALLLLSADGRMSVTVEAGSLSAGETVTVLTSDGTRLPGTVWEVLDGMADITVPDENAGYQDSITVLADDGSVLGEGCLTVHSPLQICGYAGTVSSVCVTLNARVSAGQTLVRLTDTSYAGTYQNLLSQRRELEEQLGALFAAYEQGGITAPCDGYVSDLNENIYVLNHAGNHTPSAALTDGTRAAAVYARVIRPLGGGRWEEQDVPGGEELPQTYVLYAKVTEVSEDSMSYTLELLSDGSTLTLSAMELFTRMGGNLTPIAAGDILELTYLAESETLLSVTVYRAGSGSGSDIDIGSLIGGFSFGGMGSAAKTEEANPDFSVKELTLCSVAPFGEAKIQIAVDEKDIRLFHPGQSVEVSFDALPEEDFTGTVSDIDLDGTNNGGSSKFAVTVSLPRTRQMLAGMNGSIRLETGRHDDLLLIPAAALQEDATGVYVYCTYDERKDVLGSPVYVTTGFSDGEQVAITAGLAEGDTVYYRYAENLLYTFAR